MANRTRVLVAVALATGVTGCDQVTKYQALVSLTDTFESVAGVAQRVDRFLTYEHPSPTRVAAVVPGFWEHRYVENSGSAFSLWQGSDARFPGIALLLVRGSLAIALFVWLVRSRGKLLAAGIACALGGAVGNLLDGVRFGYVIDFIHWHWKDSFSWPVFNVADVAIALGVAVIVVALSRQAPAPAR